MKTAMIAIHYNPRSTILLTQGQFAAVDPKDYDWLNQWRWMAKWNKDTRSYYAARTVWMDKRKRTIYMHRLILGLNVGDKSQGHHEDHDTLNNRRYNLEPVTARGNGEKRLDQSRFGIGVAMRPCCFNDKPYQVSVAIDGVRHHVGVYSTPKQAQQARREYLDSFVLDPKQSAR